MKQVLWRELNKSLYNKNYLCRDNWEKACPRLSSTQALEWLTCVPREIIFAWYAGLR